MLLSKNDKTAEKILKYSRIKFFRFIRSPFHTEFKDLEIIPEIRIDYDENANLKALEIVDDLEHSRQIFGYDTSNILLSGKEITKKSFLNDFEIESLIFSIYTFLFKLHR